MTTNTEAAEMMSEDIQPGGLDMEDTTDEEGTTTPSTKDMKEIFENPKSGLAGNGNGRGTMSEWKKTPKFYPISPDMDNGEDMTTSVGQSVEQISTSPPPISNIVSLSQSAGNILINKQLNRQNLSSLHRSPTYKPVPRISVSSKLNYSDRRANILREILSTETAYVSFLKVVIDIYLAKLREKDILPENDIESIFSNIDSILTTHIEIQSKIKERFDLHQDQNTFPNQTIISDIFITYGPFLKVYSVFVNNYYNNALQLIKNHTTNNKKFKSYLQECKYSPNARKLDLNDLLIMPAQRIPRYVLLLEELAHHTNKEEQEYTDLQKSIEVMKSVASYVNSSTNLEDKSRQSVLMVVKLQQLLGPKVGNLVQPHRKFIKSDELNRLVLGSDGTDIEKRKVVIHLFNDILIYAIKNKFWRKISLDEIWIRSKKVDKIIPGEKTFEIYSKSLSCIFIDENISIKLNDDDNNSNGSNSGEVEIKSWSKLIETTINNWIKFDQKSKEKRLSLLEDVQIKKDLTFEERQFYFESLNSTRKEKGLSVDLSTIEGGIVDDRKKKIEDFLQTMQERRENSRTSSNGGHISASLQTSPSMDEILFSDSDESVSKVTSGTSSVKEKKTSSRKFKKSQSAANFFSSSGPSLLNSSNVMSHIVLTRTNVIKQGYLTKIGEVVKNWKRRWFIMENNYLFYLKNKNSNKVLGRIPLIGSKIETIPDDAKSFNIVTKLRTYFIIADTDKDSSEWINVMNEALNNREKYLSSMKAEQLKLKLDYSEAQLRSSGSSSSSWHSASPTGRSSSPIFRLSIGSSGLLSASLGAITSQGLTNSNNLTNNNQPLSSTEDEYEDEDSSSSSEYDDDVDDDNFFTGDE